MKLTRDQIKEIALSEKDEWIEKAREDAKRLRLHFYGEGKTRALTKLEGLENDRQIKLRQDHSVSNAFLVENLLGPCDNIWSAKGGSTVVQTQDKEGEKFLKEEIANDLRDGLPARKYMQQLWFDRFITDPNGLQFTEVSKDGERSYPTHKAIESIKNMEVTGIRPEYICFEPEEIINNQDESSEDEKKYELWIVDDVYYTRVSIKKGKSRILEQRANSFGYVPAVQNSPIIDTLRGIKVSPIWKQIELLDNYLINNSTAQLYKFLHDYPLFWIIADDCPTCDGIGEVEKMKDGEAYMDQCPSCGGKGMKGRRDVSDVFYVRYPESDEQKITPDIAGFVQPAPMFEEHRDQLNNTEELLYFSHWRTTIEKSENETATGRFIDAQQVMNRLNVYADIAEQAEQEILKMAFQFYKPKTFKSVSVNYPRRFLVETPDQVWKKYLEAKEKKAPVSALDQLLEQYYISEYQKNEVMQEYYLKLIKLEPHVHLTIQEVIALPISEAEKAEKIYYSEWISGLMVNEIVDTKLDQLKEKLNIFVNEKLNKNGKQPEHTGAEATNGNVPATNGQTSQ